MVDDERVPSAKRLSEQRKRDAALRYHLEMESCKVGWKRGVGEPGYALRKPGPRRSESIV
jgi:hypothetical protein